MTRPVKRKAINQKIPAAYRRAPAYAAGLAAVAMMVAGAAAAQDGTVVVGGPGGSDVSVDLGAISGGYYGNRQLLVPNSKFNGPVVLRPPGAAEVKLKKPGSAKRSAASSAPPKSEPRVAATTPEAVTTPPSPPPAPKLAAEPPPPKTKKAVPVETEPLTPKAGDTAAAPEPPPPPPAPGGTEESAAGKTAEKKAGEAAVPPPPPPPPPAETDMANAGAEIPPPPPPPSAGGEEAGAASPESPSTQVATLTPEKAVGTGGKPMPVTFAEGSAVLGDSAKEALAAVAKTMTGDSELRLQIVAYATGSDDNASQARRLSLSRALAVRSYLIDNGIRSTRMDVRALGNKYDSGPGDRVDLVVVNQ